MKSGLLKPVAALFLLLFITTSLPAQSLLSWVDKKMGNDKKAYITFFASGNIKGVATGNKEDFLSANGAIGLNLGLEDLSITGSINFASTIDTLQNSFSNAFFNPANGISLQSGLLDFRWAKTLGSFGVHSYGSFSSSNWTKDDQSKAVTVAGLGLLIYKKISASQEYNKVSFGYEFGVSCRGLLGDLAFNSDIQNNLIGTKTRFFGGFEGGLSIQVNNLEAAMQFYYYLGPHISGLTGGQITTGVSLNTDLFTFTSSVDN